MSRGNPVIFRFSNIEHYLSIEYAEATKQRLEEAIAIAKAIELSGRTQTMMRETIERVLLAWMRQPDLALAKLFAAAADSHSIGANAALPQISDIALVVMLDAFTKETPR